MNIKVKSKLIINVYRGHSASLLYKHNNSNTAMHAMDIDTINFVPVDESNKDIFLRHTISNGTQRIIIHRKPNTNACINVLAIISMLFNSIMESDR